MTEGHCCGGCAGEAPEGGTPSGIDPGILSAWGYADRDPGALYTFSETDRNPHTITLTNLMLRLECDKIGA